MVVTTYRSDELNRRHPLRPLLAELERSPCARRIELERFDRDEVADQLADIIGSAPDADVVERMYGRSEGNPLFTEELLAAGVDARAPLPPSLREALLLRVERLPAETQRLLRLLAVSGGAGHELLAEAADVDGAELSASIREAIAAQIVVVDGAGRYGFRHALLREVVYDDLLPGERSELHLVCAHALERGAAEGDGAWTATGIAHHYYSAGDQPRALESALAAARSVQRLHAYGEAAGLLDRALELWNRVPDPEEHAGADHAEILARAGRAHYLAGDEEMGAALYEAAAGEIDEEAEPERAAKVLTMLATCQWSLGLADRSRATQRRGLELAREDSPERAAAARPAGPFPAPPGALPRRPRRCARGAGGRRARRARPRRRAWSIASAARCSRSARTRRRGRGWTSRSSSRSPRAPATTSPRPSSTTPTPSTSPGAATRRARSGGAASPRSASAPVPAGRARCAGSGSTWPRSSSISATGRRPTSSCGRPAPSIAASRSPTRTSPGSARAGPRRARRRPPGARPRRRAARERARAPVHRAARGPARRARAPRRRPRRGGGRGRPRHRPDPVLQRGRRAPRARRGRRRHDRRRRVRARPRPRRRGGRGDGRGPGRGPAGADPRGGRGRRPARGARPGGDRRGGAVQGPRRGRSRALGSRRDAPGTTSSGPTTGPWPGGARRRPSSPEATEPPPRRPSPTRSRPPTRSAPRGSARRRRASALAPGSHRGSRRGRRRRARARRRAALRPHPARAPGARAARHGGHEPRDRRAALHGGEDRQRPRLAHPHEARRSRPDRGRRGRPPPRARGRALARRRLSG